MRVAADAGKGLPPPPRRHLARERSAAVLGLRALDRTGWVGKGMGR